MRELVIKKIKGLYCSGHRDCSISLLSYLRRNGGRPPLEHVSRVESGLFGYKVIDDIDKFTEQLTDEELLIVLGSQLCDQYR